MARSYARLWLHQAPGGAGRSSAGLLDCLLAAAASPRPAAQVPDWLIAIKQGHTHTSPPGILAECSPVHCAGFLTTCPAMSAAPNWHIICLAAGGPACNASVMHMHHKPPSSHTLGWHEHATINSISSMDHVSPRVSSHTARLPPVEAAAPAALVGPLVPAPLLGALLASPALSAILLHGHCCRLVCCWPAAAPVLPLTALTCSHAPRSISPLGIIATKACSQVCRCVPGGAGTASHCAHLWPCNQEHQQFGDHCNTSLQLSLQMCGSRRSAAFCALVSVLGRC